MFFHDKRRKYKEYIDSQSALKKWVIFIAALIGYRIHVELNEMVSQYGPEAGPESAPVGEIVLFLLGAAILIPLGLFLLYTVYVVIWSAVRGYPDEEEVEPATAG